MENKMISPLWIDSANALDRLESSQEEDYIKRIAKDHYERMQ